MDKPWADMNAEEREAHRQEQLRATGGAECDECGTEDYWHAFTEFEGKNYCHDCLETLMEDELIVNGESERYLTLKKLVEGEEDHAAKDCDLAGNDGHLECTPTARMLKLASNPEGQ